MKALARADFYDAELRRHYQHFRSALAVRPTDHILDIGCGAGQSTRDAAYDAKAGSVVGVDVSEEMLEIARQRCASAGIHNVDFQLSDAGVHGFPAAHFNLCISRFGTMFFADPVCAFANISGAMRPGARLVLMAWQPRDRNEWAIAIQEALAPTDITPTGDSAAFSLGDRDLTTRILMEAGFTSINFTGVREPVFYGPSIKAAQDAIVGLFLAKDGAVDASAVTPKALQRLRTKLSAHQTGDGVWFNSEAWIVTATKVG